MCLKENISSIGRDELLQKAVNSAPYRFLGIHNSPEPYLLYRVRNETPRIYKYVKLAARLLGLMFSGEHTKMICRSCGDLTNKITEHVLLFCKGNETFRNKPWESLIHRFKFTFYRPVARYGLPPPPPPPGRIL